mgnify:CR=1 FL=1
MKRVCGRAYGEDIYSYQSILIADDNLCCFDFYRTVVIKFEAVALYDKNNGLKIFVKLD